MEREVTPEQFMWWIGGLSEVIAPAPTPEQWAMIKDKIKEVEPERQFVSRSMDHFNNLPAPIPLKDLRATAEGPSRMGCVGLLRPDGPYEEALHKAGFLKGKLSVTAEH
jgi:hypothetical protein